MSKTATEIIELFGGILPMSQKLKHNSHTTVQGWKNSGQIPHWRHHEVLEAAKVHGLKLEKADLGKRSVG